MKKHNFKIFNDNEKNAKYLSETYGIMAPCRDLKYLYELLSNNFTEKLTLSDFVELNKDSYDLVFIKDNSLDNEDVNFSLKAEIDDSTNTLTIRISDVSLFDFLDILEEGFDIMKEDEDSDLSMGISFCQGTISFLEPLSIVIYYSGSYIFKREDHSQDYMWFNYM